MNINLKDRHTITEEVLNQRAELYARVEEKIETKGQIKGYLAFRLGEQWYMVDTQQVSEVLNRQRIALLPRKPKLIAGIMNIKGNIVLMADMKALFNITEATDPLHAKVILTRIQGDLTGFMVDEILGVQHIDTYGIKPVIATIQWLRPEFIDGLYQQENRHFVLLNLERLWLEMANKLGMPH